jgi:NitT/TauT family transport system substrate-binding protein
LVVTRKLATEHPERVQKLVQAHVDAVRFLREHRDEARELVQRALLTYAKKELPRAVLDAAFAHVTPEWEIPTAALEKTVTDGRALGYLPREGDLSQAVDAHWVTSVAR